MIKLRPSIGIALGTGANRERLDADQLPPEQAGQVNHRNTGVSIPTVRGTGSRAFKSQFTDYYREWGLMDSNRRYDE